MKEKVVLAYSGGLDTTAIIPWLKETFNYDVICCCIDCGQGEELDGLEERAKLSGAAKLYIEDIVDDFGSGYSSYGVLQDYNFDILKIDMSLVRQIETNPKSRSILKSIIAMAHELGMQLVAEGAETEEQVVFLRENDCDCIQGYYYSKPLPEDEFLEYLGEN